MVDVVSMWVRPSVRGHGVGAALVGAAAGWAKARDHDALYLWVTETNTPARLLYERCGFTPTGEHQPLPSDLLLAEIRIPGLFEPETEISGTGYGFYPQVIERSERGGGFSRR